MDVLGLARNFLTFKSHVLNYNRGNNIMKQCNILVSVWFATSKAGLDFWFNIFCIRIVSRVSKWLKT